MTFQEMADIVKNSENFPYSMEVDPYVYEENNIVNTVVFEFGKTIVTLHDDGTYSLEKNNEMEFPNC